MKADPAAMRLLIADDQPLFRDGLRSLPEARGVDVAEAVRLGMAGGPS